MKIESKCSGYPHWFLYGFSCGCAIIALLLAAYLTVNSKTRELFKGPINPLALNSSPYGMLLSSLLQQPINVEWHKGIEIHETKDKDDHVDKKDHDDHDDHHHAENHGHHHAEGEHCDECDIAAGRFADRASGAPLFGGVIKELGKLTQISTVRTNPYGISPAHKLYIARNIEKKMLLAYNLDPTNYAAYDTYFLFLTENPVSGLGNAERIKQAQLITRHTLGVAAREQVNPFPAITAALATYNLFMLHHVEGKSKDKDFNRMLYLQVSGHLAKYLNLKTAAEKSGSWNLVPDDWKHQAEERVVFLHKVAKGLAETDEKNATK